MTTAVREPQPASADPRDRIVAAMSTVPPRDRRSGRVAVVLVLSLLVVGYAVATYGGLDPSAAKTGLRPGLPWHFPLLIGHIACGCVALTLGPLQLVRSIRRRPRVHRYIGRGYLFAGVFPASIAGIVLASITTGGLLAALGLALGDLLWFTTAVAGYRTARAGRWRAHQRWMLRNLALTFAAVTFRAWLGLLIVLQLPLLHWYGDDFGVLFAHAYTATTWLAFVPNVLVLSWLVSRQGRRPARPRSAAPAR